MNKERANAIGEAISDVGRKLPGNVILDDLFNYHIDDGLARGNPPSAWLLAISGLNRHDKTCVVTAIGKANRLLSKLKKRDATLKDLREAEDYLLHSGAGSLRKRDRLGDDSILLLSLIFGRP